MRPGTADARDPAAAAIEACAALAGERGIEIAFDRTSRPIRIGVDADLAGRILQPLVENACRYGRRRVRVEVTQGTSEAVYTIRDDGLGVAAEERELIFEPGARGNAADGDSGGAGLGLSLARRLARAVDGDVEAEPSSSGGIVRARLPLG